MVCIAKFIGRCFFIFTSELMLQKAQTDLAWAYGVRLFRKLLD
ncbi:hypothetical protein PAUR_a4409 [Pseudoalteromonas aurantia 208]|uniref:Uncharacterized protein n=1 Tax=Pseudoalteromonas aurantia 208 TaxID=1314867 RepID=A0ABR9EGG6_9GAMM|nr:hypothetical protein [Pseudoalteromonas aurantia 208]